VKKELAGLTLTLETSYKVEGEKGAGRPHPYLENFLEGAGGGGGRNGTATEITAALWQQYQHRKKCVKIARSHINKNYFY
jgi:hypothetical protein